MSNSIVKALLIVIDLQYRKMSPTASHLLFCKEAALYLPCALMLEAKVLKKKEKKKVCVYQPIFILPIQKPATQESNPTVPEETLWMPNNPLSASR